MPYGGHSVRLGMKKETTLDESPVAGAQTVCFGIVPNADFDDAVEFKDFWTVNSDRDMYMEAQGKKIVNASIPTVLQNGRMIYLAMGTETVTGTTANYVHAISATQTVPSMCIEPDYMGTNNFGRFYTGMKINTLEVEGKEGGEVSANASLMGCRGTKITSTTMSTITNLTPNPYMYYNGAITLDASTFDLTTFKWSVNNNLYPKHTVRATDGQIAKYILEGKREYEFTANMLLKDDATLHTKAYDMLLAGSKFTLVCSLTRGANDTMTLTASNCTIRSAPHNVPEVGTSVEVPITVKMRTCAWSVNDAIASY